MGDGTKARSRSESRADGDKEGLNRDTKPRRRNLLDGRTFGLQRTGRKIPKKRFVAGMLPINTRKKR